MYIWSCLCTFLGGALDRAKSCRSTFQSAGRETSLHGGKKEENNGHVHLEMSLARWETEGWGMPSLIALSF